MTGSGKTCLCVGLLEEAALQGIPAIVVDPKGNLTNLVLSFPDLAPEDFAPWIDANSAQSGVDFTDTPEFMKKSSWWSAKEKEFEHWIYETDTVSIRSSKALGVSAGPEISNEDFRAQCKNAAAEKSGEAVDKLESKFKTKQTTLENKIKRQELKVDKYKKNLTSRSLDTALEVGESLLNFATKRKFTGLSYQAEHLYFTLRDCLAKLKI
jgi:hypothetical protein